MLLQPITLTVSNATIVMYTYLQTVLFYTGSSGLVLFPAISEGLNKTCTNLSIFHLFNNFEISLPRFDLIILQT